MKPVLSLIIATLERVPELERCLCSLPQGERQFEVIVVDQSPAKAAREVVRRFEGALEISYLYQSAPAASSARNLGVAHARGEWVGFPDDDARFRDDTLPELLKRIRSGHWDLITGMTCDDTGQPTAVSWRDAATDINRLSLRDTFAESTLFIKRQLFLSCGGFDPIFGPGGSFSAEEGIDLVRRIQSKQPETRMRFFPQIRLIHADTSPYKNEASLRQARGYARARGACFARHWRQASKRRIASELCRHALGSVVLRGLRRRSRLDCLIGYVAGFCEYRKFARSTAKEPQLQLDPMAQ